VKVKNEKHFGKPQGIFKNGLVIPAKAGIHGSTLRHGSELTMHPETSA
jgi:hypothetical protein